MRLFALADHRPLAAALEARAPALQVGDFELGRFANGELHVELRSPVAGEDVAVIGSARPPDRNLVELTLLCDTLRRHGARSIVAVLPYLAYARQDRPEAAKSLGAAWLGALLAASGVTRALTIDVHSPRVALLWPMPLISLDPSPLLADALGDLIAGEGPALTIVAPDRGAIARAERLRRAAGVARAIVRFDKVRTPAGVRSHLVGEVGERALVVDDILDTGGTLIACAQGLREAGARRIAVAVSHGLFTGDQWPRLWELGVDAIVCTESVGRLIAPDRRITTLECAPVIAPALQPWIRGETRADLAGS